MFSKFRRVLVFLLTSSAVFLCFICMRDSLWYRPRRRTIYYLANESSSSSSATGRNVYALEEESGEDVNDIPATTNNNKDVLEPAESKHFFFLLLSCVFPKLTLLAFCYDCMRTMVSRIYVNKSCQSPHFQHM